MAETETIITAANGDALLAYKCVRFDNFMASTKGAPGNYQMATYTPTLPKDQWFYVGHAAINNYNDYPYALIVKELSPGILKPVNSWEKVWDNTGSSGKAWLSLWHGIPPNDDYVVLGGIFSSNKSYAPPTDSQTRGIRAVNKKVLEEGWASNIWSNYNDGSINRGSVWRAFGSEADPGVLIPAELDGKGGTYFPPSGNWVWVFDDSKVLNMGSEEEIEAAKAAREKMTLMVVNKDGVFVAEDGAKEDNEA